MAKRQTIIGLTSAIVTATTSIVHAELPSQNNTLYNSSIYAMGDHGGGESGEGGYHAKSLMIDDIAFTSALMAIYAHYVVGLELYENEEYEDAQGFFGHPISEVLIELEPAFEKRKIKSFSEDMHEILEIVSEPERYDALEAQAQVVFDKIDQILVMLEEKDPENYPMLITKVNADMFRRAKLEYFAAIKKDDMNYYYDGLGYFKAARKMFDDYQELYSEYDASQVRKLNILIHDLKAYFDGFELSEQEMKSKRFAGITAKIELILLNLTSNIYRP